MHTVRIQKAIQHLQSPLSEISNLIRNGETIEIISKSINNIEFVVDALFNNFSTRRNFFSRDFERYILIELKGIPNDVAELDSQLLIEVFKTTNLEFKNISSLKNYLEEEDRTLVIYSDSTADEYVKRLLLAYKFILSDEVCFIFGSTKESELVSKKVYLTLDDKFISEYLNITAEQLDIEYSEATILREVNGDIGLVYRYLIQNQQIPLITEEELQPQTANLEGVEPEVVFPSEMQNIEETITEVLDEKASEKIVEEVKPSAEFKEEAPIVENRTKKSEIKETANIPSESINLTDREARIYYLLQDKKFITRDELVEGVWGKANVGKTNDDAIDQFISRLRRKFVKAGYDKSYIYSKKGEGVGLLI